MRAMYCAALAAGTVLVLALGGCATPAAEPSGPWARDDAWLCRPGRADLCGVEHMLTTVAADGTRSTQALRPDPNAPVDCFYVYPTISEDPNDHSTLVAGPGEKRAVLQQFAPFASVCRPYAPMYRQTTLAGLNRAIQGQPNQVNPELPIADVRAAWAHYLRHDNKGRPVVLIGHSQGTRMLTELIKRDIEGQPAQKLVLSALLAGLNTEVPAGAVAGGTFKQMPLCRQPGEKGCIVAWTTFRADAPPPANARFGRSNKAGVEIACTDPVRLSGVPLRPMFAADVNLLGRADPAAEWQGFAAATRTSYVSVPGMLKAQCVSEPPNSYFALSLDQPGTRPARLPGDLVVGGRTFADWGLHLIDVNVVMGNLLEIVRRQSR